MAQTVKKLPAMRETWVQSLGWEDALEEALQSIPVFLPGESPWTEEPGGLQSMGCLSCYTFHGKKLQEKRVVLDHLGHVLLVTNQCS